MPELPEVEAARQAVEDHCLGKKIVKAIIADDSKVINGVSPKDFQASLLGKTIVAAHRKGKNMWFQLDSPPFPTFQFGMAGAIYIKGVAITKYKRAAVNDSDEWPSKYSKFFVELNDGLELSFTDKRRFAKVRLLDNPISVPPISELGPDALLEPMTVDEFYNSLKKKNIGTKALLLDQSFISGIGNWMADEVLYQARIHPLQVASRMSKESCETLLKCINEVTEKAIEVGADSSQFPSNWIFHYREKKLDKASVDGKKIEFINAGGRTTAYVPELQKLIGNQNSTKAGGQARKNTKVESENVEDDTGSEEEGKGKLKMKSTVTKKPSTKRKSMRSNNDSDKNDEEEEQDEKDEKLNGTRGGKNPRSRNRSMKGSNKDDSSLKKKNRGKIIPAKRKSKDDESEPDDDVSVDGDDDNDDEDQDVTNIKSRKTKTAKTSKKRDEPSLKQKWAKKA